jgi:phenylpropionate dioxygenase-like ring-hydroxylating dioxygenase large terminal subunit
MVELVSIEHQANSGMVPTETIARVLAGGPDPTCFDWKAVWYPVHYVDDLDKTKPTPFTLLDQDLVIWWDASVNAWRVFADQCPHRLAPLSEGRIADDGLLECPYHGWAFSGAGRCERIPQQVTGGTAEQSQRACVPSLPAVVKQGLLFVYPGKPDQADATKIPIVEPLDKSPEDWVCLSTFRDLPYDALTLLENVLDSSHVPYTHHRSVGNRANAGPVELEVLEPNKYGFRGLWEEGPRRGQLGRQDSKFIAPNLMWHDLTSKQFGRTMTVVYATPIRKGECRLFARFPFKFNSKLPAFFIQLTPQWYGHIGQNAILEDDQVFLHLQERCVEQRGGSADYAKACYLPTRADRFVLAFRQWVDGYNANPFPGQALPPARSRSSLMDRYQSHVVHCASCRTALENLKKIRLGVAVAGAIAWAMLPLLLTTLGNSALPVGIALTLWVLLCGASWLSLGQLERRFYQGRAVPPRNQPEKSTQLSRR